MSFREEKGKNIAIREGGRKWAMKGKLKRVVRKKKEEM